MAIIRERKREAIVNAGEGMEPSYVAGGNGKWYNYLGKPFGSF